MANIIADHYRKTVTVFATILSGLYQCGYGSASILSLQKPTKMTSCGSETLLTASSVFGSLQKGPFPFPQPYFMANIIADLYKKDRIRIPNHPLWQISLRISTKRTVSVSATILYGKYHCGSLQNGPYPYPQPSFMANIIADPYKKDHIRIRNSSIWRIWTKMIGWTDQWSCNVLTHFSHTLF